jgi:histidinol-phosphatase (PHP family)
MAKLKIDLHVHSNNSCDSESTIDQMCQGAIVRGLSVVCFTEHVDMNHKDAGYGFFRYGRYSEELKLAREKYRGQLVLLKGVEFSEPHVYPNEFETVVKAGFDFVLGSVHWVDEFGAYWANDSRRLPDYPVERFFDTYYREVLKTVRFGGFDSLAHIDFPKRYLLKKYEPPEILHEIVAELIKKGVALELNSQPIRKGYSEINPSIYICDLYSRLGGIRVTTGSDAHTPEDVGRDFNYLDKIIEDYRFQPVHFLKRKEFIIR